MQSSALSLKPIHAGHIYETESSYPNLTNLVIFYLYISTCTAVDSPSDGQFDDQFCSTFANRFDVLVVSIEYGTAPPNKFPGSTNDVVVIL